MVATAGLQNQDTLRSRQACLDRMEACLTASPPKSCVIDNTSPSRSVRLEYLERVRRLFPPSTGVRVRVRCFYFTAPIELAMHNSVYRALCEPVDRGNGKQREVLPLIAFTSFRANLEIPTADEGEARGCLSVQSVQGLDKARTGDQLTPRLFWVRGARL